MDNLRVLVVDDHAAVRGGLRSFLEAEPNVAVVGESADGPTPLEASRDLRPDVVMDVSVPGKSGIEVTEHTRRERPATKVVALTAHENRMDAQ